MRWPTSSTWPGARGAAATASASARVSAIGFSTNTCLPAASARSACPACSFAGAAAEIGEAGLEVERRRVVDLGLDPAVLQVVAQGVASRGAHHEMVPDVAGRVVGQREPRDAGERLPVALGVAPSRRVPLGQ